MTSLVTERLVGPWALEERIGAGGQAAVYRARHAALGRPAAVKLFHRAVWSDRAFRVRFRRECDALLALDHPHIVPIHDAGEQDGRGYLVMGLARGGSLAERLAEGPLAPDEALALLGAAADALDTAHAAGLLHRDVTPANILLDPQGPWLADFGVARRLDATALTGEGLLVGTAGFLAPEVIEGATAGPASDRYALAAVAFEALAGRPPFQAEGVPGLLYAHMRRTPPRASSVRAGLPRELDAALARGLAKDPRDRPGSARDLVAGIERALAPPRTGITRLLTRPRGFRPRRRRRLLGSLAAAAAGLALTAGAVVGVSAALESGGAEPRSAPAAAVAPEPVPTVPGPDGAAIMAGPARPGDLPGLAGAAGAAAADAGEVRVAALPGGWPELAATRAALERRGLRLRPLTGDTGSVALIARRPELADYFGGVPRYALLAIGGPGGPRAVVVRGLGEAPERYAAGLASALGPAVVPVP